MLFKVVDISENAAIINSDDISRITSDRDGGSEIIFKNGGFIRAKETVEKIADDLGIE